MANEYKKTMNLPKTDFPMRAGLAKNEPARLEKWYKEDVFGKLIEQNKDKTPFVLHDGPPYANGPIHIGHALNKISKDIINRYYSEQGYLTPYVPGWDCHGQPIEHKIEVKLGTEKFRKTPQAEIRRLCREYALENVDIQREGFKRLGVLGLWNNPYLTLNHDYEAGDVEVFKKIYLDGAIFKGRKPVHWCIHCETALAEAEIEYADVSSPSLYVKFFLIDKPEALKDLDKKLSVLIWTTTAWTLPSNSGVALNEDADYVVVIHENDAMIFAEELVETVIAQAEIEDYELYKVDGETLKFKGKDLVGLHYQHPTLEGETGRIIVADHVTLDGGTGAVHTAPGHGQEDYVAGIANGLEIRMPVKDDGSFDKGAGQFEGINIEDAVGPVLKFLKEKDELLVKKNIKHSYPHCWRCKNPVYFRATEQWFVSMDKAGLRESALEAMKDVKWYPEWSINRIGSMVRDRPDWTISRQRSWGIPIPVHHCKECGETIATEESFDAVIDLFRREGSDAWFTTEPKDYLPKDLTCPKCGAHAESFEPEKNILDVWWESGVSHTSVLDNYDLLSRPADMYLEGSDQHRGWFQSSLLTSVGAYGKAPYKSVVSQGFTVDEQGKKMSKSIGNVIDPNEIADTLGADVLRLWVASTDSSQDMSVSKSILERTSDAYRRIRNTFRFLLSNLYDFDPQTDAVSFDEMRLMDKWALARLNKLVAECKVAYENYRFHHVYRAVYAYVVSELSSIYMDALKDRLYSDAPDSLARRSAQTVLAEILSCMMSILQPILAFTVDEVFEYTPEGLKQGKDFAALISWYEPKLDDEKAATLQAQYDKAMELRDVVTKALEDARLHELIGKSQEADIVISAPQSYIDEFESEELIDNLNEFFIVHNTSFKPADEISVEVLKASGEKCPRCWNIRELGLDPDYPELCERCAHTLRRM